MLRRTLSLVLMVVCVMSLAVCSWAADCRTQPFANVLSQDGVPIAYAVYGPCTDVTIVFIHGWSCDSRYWHAQVPYFSKKYRTITLDLAGHGNSGSGRQVYTMESLTQDVAAVLKAADVKKAILAGHSMSGELILRVAKAVPERVIGVVGIDTLQDVGLVWTEEDKHSVYDPLAVDFKTNAEAFIKSMFRENADKALVDTVVRDVSSAVPAIALNVMSEYFKENDAELVKDLAVPLKCVNADLWPTNVERNKAMVPSFEIAVMKGRGHFLMLEAPDEFNRLLDDMVRRILREAKRK